MTGNVNQIADSTVILSYVLNYLLTYTLAASGAIAREIYIYKKHNIKISLIRIVVGGGICSVTMIAISQYTTFKFSIYVFLTYMFGMFGYNIIDFLMNAKYFALMIKNIMKELGNPILKGVSNGIDEVRKEQKEDAKKKEEQNNTDNSNNQQNNPDENASNSNPENPLERFSREELLEQIRRLEGIREETESNNES